MKIVAELPCKLMQADSERSSDPRTEIDLHAPKHVANKPHHMPYQDMGTTHVNNVSNKSLSHKNPTSVAIK